MRPTKPTPASLNAHQTKTSHNVTTAHTVRGIGRVRTSFSLIGFKVRLTVGSIKRRRKSSVRSQPNVGESPICCIDWLGVPICAHIVNVFR